MSNTQYDNHILIVEDEIIIAFSLEESLIEMGYKNIDISTGVDEALAKIEKKRYDLLILDINIEKKYDGIELGSTIKKKYEDIPIIFLTGNSDVSTMEKAREVEPNIFLIKPFKNVELKINLDLIFFQRTENSSFSRNKSSLLFSKSFMENHPNLIIRLSVEGKILYVNPLISRITGKNPADYDNKHITTSDFEEDLLSILNECIVSSNKKKRKFTFETNFNTILGERMMFVMVTPEYNNNKEIEAVIILMQDITDQKIATFDLVTKNKKITDSINYSKKIQEALLPTSVNLQYYIPDSAILLLPKDPVSGDFPWVYKKGNYIYIAAIDCTGHGVPGALLSVIIHFLLNEIIKLSDALLPGKILEILHLYTKRTLKQHMPEIESNDGADIALCRIDLANKELYFSGAHRPLLYLRNGEVHEIKGDRKPIGGEHYTRNKKRLSFINHHVQLEHNDTFIIYSDGLTDQFGGPAKPPVKFGINNVRKILENTVDITSSQILLHLENTFKNWKTNQKQLDDVLVICFNIKF